ncbi:MAG: bifunctional homocysteine S-methyltransferase/methylenetetrahydrofolate reductase, partial [Acidimicrobiia bacterium]|nr:bifunctional homocysteine S-methyltransferase/methylenetetrahydrofolate reductase [Acidimicrobiia bacterium]
RMTTEDDGNTLDGTPPEQFAPELERRGAAVIGVNCSVGPAPMLETVERLAAATRARLSAQPNAGRPRDIEGRNIYLSSPEYLASYARRFVGQGVRLVGGCCGTTPEHIRQIKAGVRAVEARRPGVTVAAAEPDGHRPPAGETPAVPRAEKSVLARTLASGRFALAVSLLPPRGSHADEVVADARMFKGRGVDVVSVPDGVRGSRMSALAAAVLLQQRAGIETVLQYSCRDRNLLGMQSDLLGAHAMGMRNVLLVTGDPASVGDFPDATAVFDVDSIGLTHVVSRLNHGHDIGGQPIGGPTAFHVGVLVNPGADDVDAELKRFAWKVEAGAEFAITKPVFDVGTVERFMKAVEAFGVPILAGVWPFESVLNAEFMANEVPGVQVPPAVLDRMRRAGDGDAAAREGVLIAAEVGRGVRGLVQGLHLSTPSSSSAAALAVLDLIGPA